MEVHHKPKPWHGWREFLREYVIIVVAVMTAAASGEIVDSLRWAERTRQTKEHLRTELHLIAADALAQQTNYPCARVMVGRLEQALAASGDTWLPPFVETVSYGDVPFTTPAGRWDMPRLKLVVSAPLSRWDTQAWRNAQADGTANHMSQKDNIAFGRMYEVVGRAKAVGDQLQTDIGELNALSLPQRLDAAGRVQYLRLIGRVRHGLTRESLDSLEILQRADALKIAKPTLAEGSVDMPILQAFCRQFQEGRTELIYEVPKTQMAGPMPLPPE